MQVEPQESVAQTTPKKGLIDDDIKQQIKSYAKLLVELYRVLVCTLLLLFTPQKCGNDLCTMNENMEYTSPWYFGCLCVNFITLFSFCLLYYVEMKREVYLINHLDVNKTLPLDNDSVGKALEGLQQSQKDKMRQLRIVYFGSGVVAIVLFFVNCIWSLAIISNYSMGEQTWTTIATNIVFMISKLFSVYSNIFVSGDNIYFSAYMYTKVQFNDLDPDKKHKHISL
jgi:hypothetical protein